MLSLLLDRKVSAETVDRVCHAMGMRKYESIQISFAPITSRLYVRATYLTLCGTKNGDAALHRAAFNGQFKVVERLLD